VASHSTPAVEGETDQIARSAPQFSTVTMGAHKYAVVIDASRELLEDSAFPFVPFLIEQATEEIGRLAGIAYVTGSGSSEPQGIDEATTNTFTGAGAAWTADELFDVYYDVNDAYRQNASWIANDTTLMALRKLKDTTNQYLWQPGLAAGTPDMLLGKRVVADNGLAAAGSSAKSLIFGDLRRAYTVRIVNGLDVALSTDFKFDTDLTSWRFVLRTDGKLVDENAVTVGINGA
jgi:HK97 family phage major capsid protein